MSEPVDDPDTLSPPTRPDTVREVDWLSLAPWLELLDAPRRTFGYGLLLGAIGAVVLGGAPSGAPPAPSDYPGLALSAWEGVASPIVTVVEALTPQNDEAEAARGWGGFCLGMVKLVVWAWLGLAIADRAALQIGDGVEEGLLATIARATRRLPRLLGLLLVGVAPMAFLLLYAAPAVSNAAIGSEWTVVAWTAALVWGALLLVSLGAAVLAIGYAVGAPLLWAAIAVDDADAFDAASRMYAYVYQRVARLAFYVAVLAACGVAAGVVIELLAGAALAIAHVGAPEQIAETPAMIAAWWEGAFVQALRGFYPAYFFTAAVSLYLQLRRDIDGQPTDEVVCDSAS